VLEIGLAAQGKKSGNWRMCPHDQSNTTMHLRTCTCAQHTHESTHIQTLMQRTARRMHIRTYTYTQTTRPCTNTHLQITVPMLSSASFLDRNLVTVISLDCVGEKMSLTMRFDSGYTLDSARCLSPCSLDGSKVSPLSSVTVLCLSRSFNTDDQPVLLHWTVCLSLLQQILAHQNFSRVCTTYFLRHFRASPGRLRLLRESNRGRKRSHTLDLELIHHHPFIETRTSPHTQPLSSGPSDSNTRPLPPNPSQQPQTQSGLLRQSSLSASALGKRPIPVSSNVDSKKNKTQNRPLPPPLFDLFTVLLSTFVV